MNTLSHNFDLKYGLSSNGSMYSISWTWKSTPQLKKDKQSCNPLLTIIKIDVG